MWFNRKQSISRCYKTACCHPQHFSDELTACAVPNNMLNYCIGKRNCERLVGEGESQTIGLHPSDSRVCMLQIPDPFIQGDSNYPLRMGIVSLQSILGAFPLCTCSRYLGFELWNQCLFLSVRVLTSLGGTSGLTDMQALIYVTSAIYQHMPYHLC